MASPPNAMRMLPCSESYAIPREYALFSGEFAHAPLKFLLSVADSRVRWLETS
jgi:hypothetical protein